MEQQQCNTCTHYIQHYAKINHTGYQAVNCGHCIYPRLKSRKPDSPACEHFEALPVQQPLPQDLTLRYVYTEMIKMLKSALNELPCGE